MTGGSSSGHKGLSGLEIDTPITTTAPSAAWVSGLATLVLAALAGFSASTSSAGLSSRKPLKEAWRTMPAPVQPANSISATSSGRAQCMLPSLGGLAPAAKGLVVALDLLQPRHHPPHGFRGEAGADAADIDQLLAAIDAGQQ